MSSPAGAPLSLARCVRCHGRFLPRSGPCPRCGANEVVEDPVAPTGTVRAATAIESPAQGWPAPHRLALIEVADSVHVLAIVEGDLPALGAAVTVWRDGAVYRARAAPA